jgi:hypothetical protein
MTLFRLARVKIFWQFFQTTQVSSNDIDDDGGGDDDHNEGHFLRVHPPVLARPWSA